MNSDDDNAAGVDRRRFLRAAGLLGAGIGSAGLLAACGGDSDASVDSQIGGDAGGSTTAGAGAGAAAARPVGDRYRGLSIGCAYLTLADPNASLIQQTFEEADRRAGLGWRFNVVDGQGKPNQAQVGLASLISKRVDLIYLEGIPPRLVQSELQRAKDAGIPVIGGFTAAPLDPLIQFDYAAVLESDSVPLDFYMLTELSTLHADKDEIQVALVDSDLDVVVGRTKLLEALVRLPAYRKVKIVGAQNIDLADPDGSSSRIASSFLTQFPDLDAIWANYPNSAVAAANAIAQKNKVRQVGVYGHIANAAGIEALRDPNSPMSATSWIDLIYTAYATIGYMLDVVAGNEVQRTASYTNMVPVTVLARPTIREQIPGDGTTWVFGGATYREGFIAEWGEKFA
ncbi:substrate-binding domain-containing protein [Conexibacter sp. CPCC 206217]|uniref:sugar ABC transporter substrate-binding protein n=1 Tax=Conexibacter sp. CPCC 206217 TaxID=3064574 RepID=UPI002725F34D|nr:substrate-binding domain-containing protein [Conexibacter sp. CPCC 206217]MDO8212429.1 substrate-binding domain-containing protein [Conexibacter sp. CPCC 206217]